MLIIIINKRSPEREKSKVELLRDENIARNVAFLATMGLAPQPLDDQIITMIFDNR